MNRADKLEMIRKFNSSFEDLYTRITTDSGQALRLYSGQFKGNERSRIARMTVKHRFSRNSYGEYEKRAKIH